MDRFSGNCAGQFRGALGRLRQLGGAAQPCSINRQGSASALLLLLFPSFDDATESVAWRFGHIALILWQS
jgi:hypothetical protein